MSRVAGNSAHNAATDLDFGAYENLARPSGKRKDDSPSLSVPTRMKGAKLAAAMVRTFMVQPSGGWMVTV